MTRVDTDLETAEHVRAWLDRKLAEVEPSDRVITQVTAQLAHTAQDHARTRDAWRSAGHGRFAVPRLSLDGPVGPIAWRSRMSLAADRLVALVAATLVIGVVVAGSGLIPPSLDTGQTVTSPTGSPDAPSATPTGRTIVLLADGSGEVATLAEAIALAGDGDRILVQPGTHAANVVIWNKHITIEGGGDPATVILDVDTSVGRAPGSGAFALVATDTTLRGLTLRMGAERDQDLALAIAGGSPTLEGLIILDDHPGARQTINVTGRSTATIRDNTIEGRVMLSDGSSVLFTGNDVTLREVEDPSLGVAVTINGGASVVRGNRIESSGSGIGFVQEDAAGWTASPIIAGNEITSAAHGIVVDGGDALVADNTVSGGLTGVSVTRGAATVTGNVLTRSATGLSVGSCATPTVEANVVQANVVGLRVDGCAAADGSAVVPVVGHNTICDNTTNAVLGARVAIDRAAAGICDDGPQPVVMTGTGLVTEAVEPRVERIVGDGAGHDLGGGSDIAFDEAGQAWVRRRGDTMELFRVGVPGSDRELPETWSRAALQAASDGAAWLIGDAGIGRFDGLTWTWHSLPGGAVAQAIDIAPDGAVWAIWGTDWRTGPTSVGRLGPDGWTVMGTTEGLSSLAFRRLLIGPDGSAWLGSARQADGPFAVPGFLRLRDGTWTKVDPIGDGVERVSVPLTFGPDGELWAYVHERIDGVYSGHLARLDGDAWTVYGQVDGVPALDVRYGWGARAVVDADGTLWVAVHGLMPFPAEPTMEMEGHRCPGLLSFDGTSWGQVLVGECAADLAIAPDGSVWTVTTTTREIESGPDAQEHGVGGIYRVTR